LRIPASATIAGEDYWQQPVLQQEFTEWLMRKLPNHGKGSGTVLAWAKATGLSMSAKTSLDTMPRLQALLWAYQLLGSPAPLVSTPQALIEISPPTSNTPLATIIDLATLPREALPALAVLWQAGAVEQGFREPADRFALYGGRWEAPLTRYEAAAWADWLATATYI